MQLQATGKIFRLKDFKLLQIIRETNQYLRMNSGKLYLLLPYMLYHTLVNILSGGSSEDSQLFIVQMFFSALGLIIGAYYTFTFTSEDPTLWNKDRFNRSLSRFFPQVKTFFSLFLVTFLVVFIVAIPIAIIGGYGGYFDGTEELSMSLYLSIGAMTLLTMIWLIRYLFVIPITLLHEIEGFRALKLSKALWKKNRGGFILFFLMNMIGITGLTALVYLQDNRMTQTLISMVSSAFSFYFLILESRLIAQSIETIEEENLSEQVINES